MKSFIVESWSKVFSILRWISPFQIIRILIPATRGSYRFVDGWVLSNLLLSIVILLTCSAVSLRWWVAIAIGYGGIRVFEVFIYQINVLLFDEYRARKAGKTYALRGFRRIVILLLHNYVEIIFWFALFYRNIGWAFETGGVSLDSFLVSLNFSFVTMTTFGHTAIFPRETLGDILIFIQSVIGLFMALLILARFISLIPTPETLDEFEK
jgi:hypothetical protein